MMKLFITILLMCVLTIPSFADYTYVITDGMDFGGRNLGSGQSLLMTGGGGHTLDLGYDSFAIIQGTAPYNQDVYPSGGIERISVAGYAHLDFLGGEVYEIGVGSYGTATLSGGAIQRLRTTQVVVYGQIEPYVTLYHKGYEHDELTNMLIGFWADGSPFAIQLVDVPNYTPTIDNINFVYIPEPATLLLLGLGGLLIRRKK
ncbi:MAG: PEP-CTERM sorting domain-containing protein [Phycisphaerae bacterium]|nr:PEP-CTERM sorting domain-containing protein [Phycisphaerae bacterium]